MAIPIKTLRKVIKYVPGRKSIMLVGPHGIGKTEFVKSLAEEMGMNLVIKHTSHMADPGDLTGLPYRTKITYINPVTGQEETVETTKFAPPDWMLQEKPCLVLLDEINRGMDIALNAIMQFTNDGTYDDVKLPEGSRVFACINPDEHGYTVGNLDPAQKDRFAIYNFCPTPDEWCDWMVAKYGDNVICQYIRKNPMDLDPFTNAEFVQAVQGRDVAKLPSRRNWEAAWQTILNGMEDNAWEGEEGQDLLADILEGIIGSAATIKFIEFFAHAKEMLDPEEMLDGEWTDEKAVKVNAYAMTDQPGAIVFVKNCACWLKDKEKIEKKHAVNLFNIITNLGKDASVAACSSVVFNAIEKNEKWALLVCKLEPQITAIVRKAKVAGDLKY